MTGAVRTFQSDAHLRLAEWGEGMSDLHIFVTGLVASKTLDPAVQIELGEVKTQVSAEKAREIAVSTKEH
jgi:hypothetical protein